MDAVEKMFYVSNEQNNRFVPWHGLGEPVDKALDSKEAIQMAGLDWTVESRDIFDINGAIIPGYKANTRTSDDSVLGIVGNRYKIVQNAEAFEFTDSLYGEGMKYETAGSLFDGKKIWLLGKLDSVNILGDDVDPYICFTNNHDGKGCIQVAITPIRVVCNNTLNLALSQASRTWSTRHMGDLQSKLDEARHTLNLTNEYLKNLDEEADRLANKPLSDAELEAVFDSMFPIDYEKMSQTKINNIQQMKANLFTCLGASDIKQFRGTTWGAIMAVTDQLAHYAPQRLTQGYQARNFDKIVSGHPYLDSFYKVLK